MTLTRMDVILHPVRLRILMAIEGRRMTTQQIAAALPDVAQATLYRHISKLCAAGVLEIVEEIPVRGAIEKVYIIPEHGADVSREEFARTSREDQQRYFTTFMASLLSQFKVYLQQETVDFAKDGVGYRTDALYLTKEEAIQFYADLRERVKTAQQNLPTPERRRYLHSTIVIPGSGKSDDCMEI